VTSKNQVSIPKAIAERHAICPGTELEFVSLGDAIRVTKKTGRQQRLSSEDRLKMFDQIWQRIRSSRTKAKQPKDRGWSREDLYAERLKRWQR
jgi:bifunctional DNA-binding transcriptional regulator/antitoxin component of YhaV-PrlF toxin-antitoxin module